MMGLFLNKDIFIYLCYMPGGLMTLTAIGQGNVMLNGNPQKTFFNVAYKKYTNFALQKFTLNYEGSKTLRLTEPSMFDFKVLRYADLLMDTYISLQLPNIWSPIMPPDNTNLNWRPYEFRWIENLGIKMIQEIRITCGNTEIYKVSGDYMLTVIQRDFKQSKKQLIDDMTGNTPDLNRPENYGSNGGNYPNAFYSTSTNGTQPSIIGKRIYIPINTWFSLLHEYAFPLVALQYNELHIYVTFRPLNQLYTINDVFDITNNYPRVAPNVNQYYMQLYRFLQPPPDILLGENSYSDKRNIWNADIKLICTYGFLSEEEQQIFAIKEQKYLIKQVYETIYPNNYGPSKVDIHSMNMVSNWTFYFQRSDAYLRNEWSNYTNWDYNQPPLSISPASIHNITSTVPIAFGPYQDHLGNPTDTYITNNYSISYTKEILINMAILFDGDYRENTQDVGVYKYVEKYTRTPEYISDSPYVYNFCLNTDIRTIQPSGANNSTLFNHIFFEYTTITPPINASNATYFICDPITNKVVGVNKNSWDIYNYTYDLHLFEERLNMLIFSGGNCGLMWA